MPIRRFCVVLAAVVSLTASTVVTASADPRPRVVWHWYHHSGAQCVHHYEGSWTDPDPLYWGGYQMSLWFQQRFAPWRLRHSGTANHWTPYRQTVVVRRVVRKYGWGQWPNTAAWCGLL